MERRVFIAVLMSFVVLYTYQTYFAPPPQDKPPAGRVCLGGSEAGPLWYGAAWWMDDGEIVSSVNGGDVHTVRKAGPNSAPAELIALEKSVYVVQIGDLGIELLKV